MIHKTALDLVPFLSAIEAVQNSSLLSPAQREAIISEIRAATPDEMFCPQARLTLSIINTVVRSYDGSTKKPTAKVTKENKKPQHGTSTQQKPIRKTASNPRRSSELSADASS